MEFLCSRLTHVKYEYSGSARMLQVDQYLYHASIKARGNSWMLSAAQRSRVERSLEMIRKVYP